MQFPTVIRREAHLRCDARHVVVDAIDLQPVLFVPRRSNDGGVTSATVDVQSTPDQEFKVSQVSANARSNLELIYLSIAAAKRPSFDLVQRQ